MNKSDKKNTNDNILSIDIFNEFYGYIEEKKVRKINQQKNYC